MSLEWYAPCILLDALWSILSIALDLVGERRKLPMEHQISSGSKHDYESTTVCHRSSCGLDVGFRFPRGDAQLCDHVNQQDHLKTILKRQTLILVTLKALQSQAVVTRDQR